MDCVYSCYNELTDAANDQATGKEDSATAVSSDDGAVDQDDEDTNCGQYARVLKSGPDTGHLEKVGSVGCK